MTEQEFFVHENMDVLMKSPSIICQYDWHTALGDTVKEKYESLYIKVTELTNLLTRKGVKGYFWIVASPEVASVFETATVGFSPTYDGSNAQLELGGSQVKCLGMVSRKWRVYADPSMEHNKLMIGANWGSVEPHSVALLELSNFTW